MQPAMSSSSPGSGDQAALHEVRDTVLRMLHRELAAVMREVEAYPDDVAPWRVVPGIANSGGNLALHLAGNLRYYVGTMLGNTGYVRDRATEFSARGMPRAEVVAQLSDAQAQVTRTLHSLDASQLAVDYPDAVGAGPTVPTYVRLMHLAVHASYHLGQIDYHRRIVTGNPATVNAISASALVGPLPDLPQPPADARV